MSSLSTLGGRSGKVNLPSLPSYSALPKYITFLPMCIGIKQKNLVDNINTTLSEWGEVSDMPKKKKQTGNAQNCRNQAGQAATNNQNQSAQ